MATASPFLSSVATSNIYWVENETQARNYPIAFNASVILLDRNQDFMYIKSVDSAGVMTAFRKFEVKEIQDVVNGISVDEFNSLKAEITDLKERLNKRDNNKTNYKRNNRMNNRKEYFDDAE